MHNWGPAEISTGGVALRSGQAQEDWPLRDIRRGRLAEIFRREILPRLIAAPRKGPARGVGRANPEALARHLVSGRLPQARAAIAARLKLGAAPLDVMLEDIGPAARRLGEFWTNDDYDFFDVTLAARALRDLIRELAPEPDAARALPRPSLMMALAPGETHELGADIAARVFRLAGWRTARSDSGGVCAALARERFDALGFSLSCDRHIAPLREAIREARKASRNPRLTVLVGGHAIAANAGLAKCLGADCGVPDGDIAAQFPETIRRVMRS